MEKIVIPEGVICDQSINIYVVESLPAEPLIYLFVYNNNHIYTDFHDYSSVKIHYEKIKEYVKGQIVQYELANYCSDIESSEEEEEKNAINNQILKLLEKEDENIRSMKKLIFKQIDKERFDLKKITSEFIDQVKNSKKKKNIRVDR